jgi:chemotaxis response regulator CheB
MKDCWCLDHKDALFVRQASHNFNGEIMSENHSINKEDSAPFDQPPIVCIGASAGGLDAFKEFFDHMPAETGIAFVLIPHLDPDHKSLMVEIIGRHTKMPVQQIEERTKVEPNHIYITPMS